MSMSFQNAPPHLPQAVAAVDAPRIPYADTRRQPAILAQERLGRIGIGQIGALGHMGSRQFLAVHIDHRPAVKGEGELSPCTLAGSATVNLPRRQIRAKSGW